jgi:hypothetical protein
MLFNQLHKLLTGIDDENILMQLQIRLMMLLSIFESAQSRATTGLDEALAHMMEFVELLFTSK